MTRRPVLFAVTLFTVVGLAVSACGGDDDGTAAEPPVAEPAPAEPPAEEPAPAEATELQLAADPGGGLTFDQTELSAAPGTVAIVLTNESPVPHNVAVEGSGVDVEGEVFQGGGTRTTEAELSAGEYVFYCSVPGHREAGMEGTLTVG